MAKIKMWLNAQIVAKKYGSLLAKNVAHLWLKNVSQHIARLWLK
jgi:hypothetical protein